MTDDQKHNDKPGARGPAKLRPNTMIRVNLPPDLHRKLWNLRLDRRSSIQQIVTEILEEKFSDAPKGPSEPK